MDNSQLGNLTLLNNITTPSISNPLTVNSNASTITIEFVSTGTFSANFECMGLGNVWKPIIGSNMITFDMATSASSQDSLYQISLIGVLAVRVNVTAITGNLSTYGIVRG